MAQDRVSFDAVLKDVYEGGIREVVPTKTPFLTKMQEGDNTMWSGREVVYPSKVGRNQGVGWATEMGALPTAGKQKYVDSRIPCRWMYGKISLSAQVMKSSEASRGSFAPAFQQEMDGLIKDLQNERGRAIWGTGQGILAFVNGAAASATQTLDNPGGYVGATNGARYINPGEIIGFVNPATGALRANSIRTVQSFNTTGTQIVLDSTFSSTDNDYIVRAHNTSVTDVSDTSYQKEIMGFGGLVDDGTFVQTLHNVNRTTYPIFQSAVLTGVGAWSADAMQRAIDVADQRGGGDISDIGMHQSLRRLYITSMETNRRYTGADLQSPDGGTKAAKGEMISFGGIPITVDKYAPYNTAFAFDFSGFRHYSLVKGEWAQEDGAILSRVGTGTSASDSFEAFYRIWDNFHNEYPNRCARLDGYTGTTITVVHID
jgi:hypothetical protein